MAWYSLLVLKVPLNTNQPTIDGISHFVEFCESGRLVYSVWEMLMNFPIPYPGPNDHQNLISILSIGMPIIKSSIGDVGWFILLTDTQTIKIVINIVVGCNDKLKDDLARP